MYINGEKSFDVKKMSKVGSFNHKKLNVGNVSKAMTAVLFTSRHFRRVISAL
jgi:hypothetical protein